MIKTQDPGVNRIASAFTGKIGPTDDRQTRETTGNPVNSEKDKAGTTQGTAADKIMDAFFGTYGKKSVPPRYGS